MATGASQLVLTRAGTGDVGTRVGAQRTRPQSPLLPRANAVTASLSTGVLSHVRCDVVTDKTAALFREDKV